MIIQCQQCKTKFRLDPSLISGPTARVRCSRCKHTFTVARPQATEALEVAIAPQEVASPPVSRRRYGRFLLILGVPVLLLAAGIGLWHYLPRPLRPESVSKNTGIELLHLVETRGYFVDNQQSGQLFVIEGRVRNEFPTARRWIHLRAILYTVDGSAAQHLEFYAGNLLSTHQLRNEPLDELLRLIRRRPTAEEQARLIAAQEEVTFNVPFGNLPELTNLSDYSVEILASHPA